MDDKIKVFVCSFKEVSTLDYVDKDSMGHPCVTSRHGENIFSRFKYLPSGSWYGYLPDGQIKVLDVVSKFCEENGLEYEIVDVANLGVAGKMKLVFKGIKAPMVAYKGRKIEGVPTKEDLKVLTAR